MSAKMSANFRAANEARTRSCGKRDAQLAARLLAQYPATRWPARWPKAWLQLTLMRAAYPEDSWAQTGARLGWSKDRAAAMWRRIRQASDG